MKQNLSRKLLNIGRIQLDEIDNMFKKERVCSSEQSICWSKEKKVIVFYTILMLYR